MSLNSKHYASGSPFPPLQKDKVRIYSMRFCPYVERAILVAEAKKVPYEIVNCNLKQKPEWLLEKNPAGKVPTVEILEEGGGGGDSKILDESLIVADFFDEAFTQAPSLVSADPFQKATDRVWMEAFGKLSGLYFKAVYMKVDDGTLDTTLEILRKELGVYDKELHRRGSKFYGGNSTPGMLDFMIWPWIERLPNLQKLYSDKFPLDDILKEYPTFAAWINSMKADVTVQKVMIPTDIHFKYIVSSRNGTNDYTLMEEE